MDMGVSGMDIQGTITKILEVQTKRVSTAQTAEKGIQADITAWADVSSTMSALTDAVYTMNSYDTWNKMVVTSSNASAVSATASGLADVNAYAIQVTRLAQAHTVASSSASELGVSSKTDDLIAAGVVTAGETFTIEGVTFTIGADEHGVTTGGQETLSTLRTKIINAVSGMGNKVTASILDNRLVIARATTGATAISMTEPDVAGGATPLQDLGIFSAEATYAADHVMRQAQDALFTVNGVPVTRSTNTNLTDVIENVTLTLRAETAGSSVSIDVARDTETPKAAILTFVDSYNAAVTKLETYGAVQLNGTNNPATAELQGDTMIPTMLTNLRKWATDAKGAYFTDAQYTYGGKTGTMDSLEDIGVWTAGKENRLVVNSETRLDQMLSESFDQVKQLFRGVYVAGTGYTHGVASDFYKYSYQQTTPMTGGIATHIAALQKNDKNALDEINKMIDDMSVQEESLWKQFTSMQDAIAEMKSSITGLGSSSSSS
jgi:flagellar hook-associated protein 2